jgi:nucleoside diphosphate kinase
METSTHDDSLLHAGDGTWSFVEPALFFCACYQVFCIAKVLCLPRGVVVIKPDAYENMGKILNAFIKLGFIISRMRMVRLTQEQAEAFYAADAGAANVAAKIRHIKSNTILVAELINEDCVNRLKACAATLRGQFGSDDVQDAVYVSGSEDAASRDGEFFFGAGGAAFDATARLAGCTCVIIKPHVVAAGEAGNVLDALLYQGFDVSVRPLPSVFIFWFSPANISQFPHENCLSSIAD